MLENHEYLFRLWVFPLEALSQNKPTDSYYFLVKHLSKCIKSKNRVELCSQRVKPDNIKKGHVNKTNQSGIALVNDSKWKIVVQMDMCSIEVDKNEDYLSKNVSKDKENTSEASKK